MLHRPFEGWTYQRIVKELGPIEYYVHDRFDAPLVVTDDPQTVEMSRYSVAEEIMPGRAERDGFEPEISLAVLPRTQSETPVPVPSEA